MLSEKGISIQVLSGGEEVKMAEDGYLGENLNELRLRCLVQRREPMPICFMADGKKNVVPMWPHFSDQSDVLFVKKVPVKQIYGGILTTEYLTNNIRIAVFGLAGKFEIWEVTIVSQDGLFFLTEQRTYESQFFAGEDGQILCPDFDKKWPRLMETLKPAVKEENLLSIAEYAPSPVLEFGLQRQQGRVLWYNLALQMGAIALDDKGTVARVHWKSLPLNMNGGLRKLEAGQIVSYGKLRELPTNSRSKTIVLEAQEITIT